MQLCTVFRFDKSHRLLNCNKLATQYMNFKIRLVFHSVSLVNIFVEIFVALSSLPIESLIYLQIIRLE